MSPEETLSQSFEALGIPAEGSDWLLELWRLCQTWDDIVDGDTATRAEIDHAIFLSFFGLQEHRFYKGNAAMLGPCVLNMVLKWKASDTLEKARDLDELPKCYMWRASYYDVILQVVAITQGTAFAMANAHLVLKLYGEKLSDIEEEFNA